MTSDRSTGPLASAPPPAAQKTPHSCSTLIHISLTGGRAEVAEAVGLGKVGRASGGLRRSSSSRGRRGTSIRTILGPVPLLITQPTARHPLHLLTGQTGTASAKATATRSWGRSPGSRRTPACPTPGPSSSELSQGLSALPRGVMHHTPEGLALFLVFSHTRLHFHDAEDRVEVRGTQQYRFAQVLELGLQLPA